ncbi:hypothetical protein IWQ61_005422, partial [Dispira simplex]
MYTNSQSYFGTGFPDFGFQFLQPLPASTKYTQSLSCPFFCPAAVDPILSPYAMLSRSPSPSPSPPGTPIIPTTTAAAPVSVPVASRSTSISRGFIGFARRNSARRTNSTTSVSPSQASSFGRPCPTTAGSSAPSTVPTTSRPPPIMTKDLSQITSPISGNTAPMPIRQTLRRGGTYSPASQGLVAAPSDTPSRHLRTSSAHSYALPPQVRVPSCTSLASPPDSTIVSPAMGFLSSFTSSSLGSSGQLLPDDQGQVVNQYVLGP